MKLITDRWYLLGYQGTEWIFQIREFHYKDEPVPFSVYGEKGFLGICDNLEQAKRLMIVHTRQPKVVILEEITE